MMFSIGDASRQSGVKITAIRFYEEIGLVIPSARTAGNRRQYEAEDIDRIIFVRHARQLGFDINDIRDLLAVTEKPNAPCRDADRIARHNLEAVNTRIDRLTLLKAELERMVTECAHGRVCDCRVIQILSDHDQCRHHHITS